MINVVFLILSILIITVAYWDYIRRYGVYNKKIYAILFEVVKGLSLFSMGFFTVQTIRYFSGLPTLL